MRVPRSCRTLTDEMIISDHTDVALQILCAPPSDARVHFEDLPSEILGRSIY